MFDYTNDNPLYVVRLYRNSHFKASQCCWRLCSQARKLTLSPSAPYCRVLEPLSSTRSPHLQAPSQFSRTCISPSSSLSLEERKPGTDYSLQTTNLHTASPSKELFFPYVGRGIKKDRGLQQADSTLHHAPHRHQQKKPNKQTNKKTLWKNSDLQFTLSAYCMHHHHKFLKEDTFSTSDLYGMNNMIDCTHSVQVCMYAGLISLKITTEKLRTSKIENLSCWYHWCCNLFITCCMCELHSVLTV